MTTGLIAAEAGLVDVAVAPDRRTRGPVLAPAGHDPDADVRWEPLPAWPARH